MKYYVMKVFQHPHVCFHSGLKVGFCIENGNQRRHRSLTSLVYKLTLFFSKGFNQNPEMKKMVLSVFQIMCKFIFIIKVRTQHWYLSIFKSVIIYTTDLCKIKSNKSTDSNMQMRFLSKSPISHTCSWRFLLFALWCGLW